MTAQVAQDIESIKSDIKQALMYKGGVVVAPSGSMRDIQRMLGIHCSGTSFDDAIGSLIHHGELLRHRREPLWRDDEDRPLTIRFAYFANPAASRSTFAY
jgi:hypothetical protein